MKSILLLILNKTLRSKGIRHHFLLNLNQKILWFFLDFLTILDFFFCDVLVLDGVWSHFRVFFIVPFFFVKDDDFFATIVVSNSSLYGVDVKMTVLPLFRETLLVVCLIIGTGNAILGDKHGKLELLSLDLEVVLSQKEHCG